MSYCSCRNGRSRTRDANSLTQDALAVMFANRQPETAKGPAGGRALCTRSAGLVEADRLRRVAWWNFQVMLVLGDKPCCDTNLKLKLLIGNVKRLPAFSMYDPIRPVSLAILGSRNQSSPRASAETPWRAEISRYEQAFQRSGILARYFGRAAQTRAASLTAPRGAATGLQRTLPLGAAPIEPDRLATASRKPSTR